MRDAVMKAVEAGLAVYDAKERALLSDAGALDVARKDLEKVHAELSERERVVGNRERAVDEIRTVAALRLGKIKKLEENQAELHASRVDADRRARTAETERERLEKVVAVLVHEKHELTQRVRWLASVAGASANVKAPAAEPEPVMVAPADERRGLVMGAV